MCRRDGKQHIVPRRKLEELLTFDKVAIRVPTIAECIRPGEIVKACSLADRSLSCCQTGPEDAELVALMVNKANSMPQFRGKNLAQHGSWHGYSAQACVDGDKSPLHWGSC